MAIAGIVLLVYTMTCVIFYAYARPLVTRYGYPPHHWKEYEVSSLRFRVVDNPLDDKHPVLSLGLRIFRPFLLAGAEFGLIPFDKIQA